MGFNVSTIRDQQALSESSGSWLADRDLYLSHDKTRVVEADALTGPGWLLCRKGQTVSRELAERYGLTGRTSREPVPELPHLGGGWYLLPDGSKVRGRDAAESALKKE